MRYNKRFHRSNKALEIDFASVSDQRFDFCFRLNFSGRDHAGLRIVLVVFALRFALSLYDTRHWSYLNKRWSREIADEISVGCQVVHHSEPLDVILDYDSIQGPQNSPRADNRKSGGNLL